MADMKVKISGDLTEIRSALVGLQQQLKGVGTAGKSAGAEASAGLGGIGKSIAALAAGYLSFRSLIGGVQAVVRATVEAERAQSQLRAALESSGRSAEFTVEQLNGMAEGLQKVTRFDDDAITGAQILLLHFGKIGKETIPRATEAVLDLAERMGVDLDAAAKIVGKALQDPEKGLRALRDAGVDLSDDQVEMIERLMKVGDAAGAQALVLDELAKKMGGAARAGRNTLGGALDSLKGAFGNLLEGDTGGEGIKGTIEAVNTLIKTLNDPAVKAGFNSMIQGLAAIANQGAKAIAALNGNSEINRQMGLGNLAKSYDGLLGRLTRIQDDIARIQGLGGRAALEASPQLALLRAEQAEVLALLEKRRAAASAQPATAATSAPAASPFVTMEEMRIDMSEANAAATEATRKVEALRREQQKLREETERAEEARAKELKALNDRIDAGMDEVNIALQRATGNDAVAAFMEIEQAYASLISDLKAKGDAESLKIVQSLIDKEKFQAELNELLGKAQAAMRNFGTAVATSEGAANAGEMSGGQADAAIEKSWRAQMAALQELRERARAFYKTLSGPEAQAALEVVGQIDNQIRQLDEAYVTFGEKVEAQGVDALTTFFTDLASGAKSFKEAFLDMVRAFVAGVARMIAQELALKAVQMIARSFHTGGVVGAGGGLRTINPMMFYAAPRYHSGGIAGLAPNEIPAILQRGEEVITQRDARHRANGGGQGRAVVKTPILVLGERALADALAGISGEDVVVTHVLNNIGKINSYRG